MQADQEQLTPLNFGAFIASEQSGMLRFAWFLTGSTDGARDLVQDALIRAMPHWERIVADGVPDAFLRRIMINLSRSRWRRGPARREVEFESAWGREPSAEDDQDRVSDRMALLAALRSLPLRQRTVLVLRYYEDRSTLEIADLMGCSPGTVKSQASKGLTRLRALIPTAYLDEVEQ